MTNEQIIEVYQRELSRYKDNIKHENTGESDECWDFGSFLLSRDDDNPKLWWPQAVIHIPATSLGAPGSGLREPVRTAAEIPGSVVDSSRRIGA